MSVKEKSQCNNRVDSRRPKELRNIISHEFESVEPEMI